MRHRVFSLFIVVITMISIVSWISAQQEPTGEFSNCETALAESDARIIQVAEYTSELETSYPFAFSPNGSRVAINTSNDILLVDTASLETIATLPHIVPVEPPADGVIYEDFVETIYGLVFSPDSTILASGSSFFSPFVLDHGSLQLWNGETGEHLTTFAENTSIMNLSFSFDGTYLAYSLNHEYIVVIEVATGNEIARFTDIVPTYGGLPTFSPTSNNLAFNSMSGVELWNLDDLTQTAYFQTRAIGTGLWQLIFSPDGSLLMIPNETDHSLELWNVETGERVQNHEIDHYPIWDADFNPDGTLLAAATDDGIHLWSVDTGELINELPIHVRLGGFVFSPNGTLLAATSGTTLQIWDVESGEHLMTINSPQSTNSEAMREIYEVGFSTDGNLIATQTRQQIQLWRCAAQ